MGLNDQLGDGLPSDFEGKIAEAVFLRDAKYNNGQTLLASFTIRRSDGEPDIEQRYAIGPNWNEVGNERIVHAEGAKKINKQTQYGSFAARVATLVPEEVAASIDVTEAKSWVGLRFFWERFEETKTFKNEKGEEVSRTTNRLYPTQYLGDTPKAESAAATSEEMTTLTGGGKVVSIPAALAAQVSALAKAQEYAAWTSSVAALPGALSHDDLVAALSSEEFYSAQRG